jgi:hypothetical protein
VTSNITEDTPPTSATKFSDSPSQGVQEHWLRTTNDNLGALCF